MPRELTGPERRTSIVRSSMHLFARKGFAGATTRELARAAGVSEAMVFKHFPTKRRLYRAILENKIAEAESALPLRALADFAVDPAAFLGRIAGTLVRRIEADPTFLRLLLYCALEGHPLARAFDRARASRLRVAVADAVRRWREEGRIRAVDPEYAARAFLGLVFHAILQRQVFREPGSLRIPRERLIAEIVEFSLCGLGVTPRRTARTPRAARGHRTPAGRTR